MMQVAHKIELKPNNKQKTYFTKACGTARFVYNWALAEWNRRYEESRQLPEESRERISGMSLKKEFNAIKAKHFPWTAQVTKYAAQQPFLDLQEAFGRFFKRQGGRPKFKKKGKINSAVFSKTADKWFVSIQFEAKEDTRYKVSCIRKDTLHKLTSFLASNANRDYNASLNLLRQIGRVPAESTPVEITALQRSVYPIVVTSICESGSKHQITA